MPNPPTPSTTKPGNRRVDRRGRVLIPAVIPPAARPQPIVMFVYREAHGRDHEVQLRRPSFEEWTVVDAHADGEVVIDTVWTFDGEREASAIAIDYSQQVVKFLRGIRANHPCSRAAIRRRPGAPPVANPRRLAARRSLRAAA